MNEEIIKNQDALARFAYKLTQNQHRAEDLVNDTIVRVLEKQHLFQTGTDSRKWMSRIMFNVFATEWRRRTKFESQYDPDSVLQKLSIPPDQHGKLELRVAMEELDKIPDIQKIVVHLAMNGDSYESMSRHQGVPVGTIRSRLARGRAKIHRGIGA